MSGWVKMKMRSNTKDSLKAVQSPNLEGEDNQTNDLKTSTSRCIFLGEDGKECSIYEARPIQCRTYPFWPRLLENPESWEAEGVLAPVNDFEVVGDAEMNNDDDKISVDDNANSKDVASGDNTVQNVAMPQRSEANGASDDFVLANNMGDIPVEDRYWTPSTGGCEGISPSASLVDVRTIHRNQELYKMYTEVLYLHRSGSLLSPF
jgi:Fe-S-cluster containining protein